MYLDQHGSVRACCQNTEHPLGNISRQRLRDIWQGEQASILRDAMVAQNLDHGCAFCKWQVAEGNESLLYARTFDHLEVESLSPAWPRQLELSLSNACNLQCVMCNGDWSSAIRANREGRPPLPQVYDEQFFEDLRPFLEHVEVVKLLGGEPFLGRESLRVMEMLIEMGSTAEVHVTTNGTQWSPRVERILERLPMVIVVSLDGVDKAGYEGIRVGADLDVVLANLERFRSYAAKHGTVVNLAHCLMTSNWRQFPDFLRFAEERNLEAYVNTVTYPNSLSLFHLPPVRLREIVAAFEAADPQLSLELRINRSLWKDQLSRLQHRLEGLEQGDGVDYYLGVLGFPLVAKGMEPGKASARGAAEEIAGESTTLLRIDLDHRVVGVAEGPSEVLGVELDDLQGKDIESLVASLGERHGACNVMAPTAEHPDVRRWRLSFPDETAPVVSVYLTPTRDAEGVIEEFEAYIAIESIEEVPRPAELFERMVANFTDGRSGLHKLEVTRDRITQVHASPSILGTLLSESVGESTASLAPALVELLGEIGEWGSEPAEADGATIYRVSFRSTEGLESRLEALVAPIPTGGFGAADSQIFIAELG